jgi:hypothetical protein
MFKENKYTKWYYAIVSIAKTQQRMKGPAVYYESHHIIPRLLGGSDTLDNLVLLTAREHFLCHLLLVKMLKGEREKAKMACAFNRFKRKQQNSNLYDRFRTAYGFNVRGANNPAFGKVWCHDPVTQEIHYLSQKDLVNRPDLVKGLPKQKGGNHNTTWVNNGITERCISESSTLPSGWIYGRLYKVADGHMHVMAKKRHTEDKDKVHSLTLTGRVYITKDGKQKRIQPALLPEYELNGWTLTPLMLVPKRFFEFKYSDGSILEFKNYKAFCNANNINYDTCKNRGYDSYIKQVIPTVLSVASVVRMVPARPRRI